MTQPTRFEVPQIGARERHPQLTRQHAAIRLGHASSTMSFRAAAESQPGRSVFGQLVVWLTPSESKNETSALIPELLRPGL